MSAINLVRRMLAVLVCLPLAAALAHAGPESRAGGRDPMKEIDGLVGGIRANREQIAKLDFQRVAMGADLFLRVRALSRPQIEALDREDLARLVRNLTGMLEDDAVVVYAASALGHLGEHARPALSALLAALGDEVRAERARLDLFGGVMGPSGVEALRESIRKIDPQAVPPCPEELTFRCGFDFQTGVKAE